MKPARGGCGGCGGGGVKQRRLRAASLFGERGKQRERHSKRLIYFMLMAFVSRSAKNPTECAPIAGQGFHTCWAMGRS